MRHPTSFPLAATLAVALALLAATPGPARAAAASPYGVNVHAPVGDQLQPQLSRVAQAGVGWIRIDFIWAAVETRRGVYDWRLYDALVAEARRRDLAILAIIAYTPAWATDGAEIAGVPRHSADWRRFVTRAAKRYRGRIAVWEVWNEPNLTRFWQGTQQQYWDLVLIPAADAIHKTDPKAKVAGPGLAHVASREWHRWLLETLRRAGDRLDVVTHHLYDAGGYADVTKKLDGSTQFANQPGLWDVVAPSVREVLKAADARAKPFWLTETGWQSDMVGEAAQAESYDGLLDQWIAGTSARNWVRKIFFYELQDGSADFSWGVLRVDGSAKPAYDAYRSFVAAHPPAE